MVRLWEFLGYIINNVYLVISKEILVVGSINIGGKMRIFIIFKLKILLEEGLYVYK